jgi:hypothetical protein
VHASDFDLSIDSSFELLNYLDTIAHNPFEKVEFTGVDVTATVEDTVQEYLITDVLVCVQGDCSDSEEITAFPGDTLDLSITLTPSDGSETELVEMSLTIPQRMRFGGEIEITGGSGDCFEDCGPSSEAESFTELLRSLRQVPKNNVLNATLLSFSGRVRDQQQAVFDRVVSGSVFVFVDLRG